MKISFLISSYNQEDMIINCLNSIPKSDNYEIIVVDDYSTDKTYENLIKYKDTCPPILKAYRNDKNMGSTYTYNRCLDLASGDYVVIIDNYDMFLPIIKDVLKLVDGNYDIYYYNMIMKDGNTHVKTTENRYTLSANFKIIRRSFIGDTRYSHGGFGDWYFNKKLMDKNPKEYYSNIFAYWYNYHRSGSISDLVSKGLMKP